MFHFFKKNKRKSKINLQDNLLDQVCIANTIFRTHAYLSNLKGIHKDRDLVIVATGATLNNYKPLADAIHVGVNRAVERDDVKYNYLFIQDYSGAKEYFDKIIKYDNCKKFFGRILQDGVRTTIPECMFNGDDVYRYYTNYPCRRFNYDITTSGLADFESIVFAALSFAFWTYPKRIYLVGCDCTNIYFNGKKGSSFSYLREGWEKAKTFRDCYYPDIEIISVNPVGLRGLFNDVYV